MGNPVPEFLQKAADFDRRCALHSKGELLQSTAVAIGVTLLLLRYRRHALAIFFGDWIAWNLKLEA